MENVDFYRVIGVKGIQQFLVTGLLPDTMYAIQVQSYTAAGSGPQPPAYKVARTNKVPTITGMPMHDASTYPYYIDKSVLVENRPLVKFIRNYIRDSSSVFSMSSLVSISMT